MTSHCLVIITTVAITLVIVIVIVIVIVLILLLLLIIIIATTIKHIIALPVPGARDAAVAARVAVGAERGVRRLRVPRIHVYI